MRACMLGHPHDKQTHRVSEAVPIVSTGIIPLAGLKCVNFKYCTTCLSHDTKLVFKQTIEAKIFLRKQKLSCSTITDRAVFTCPKPRGQDSIWILNPQQCLKNTDWVGLPSDHRGPTVHYLLNPPINFLPHRPSLCLQPPLSLLDFVGLRLPSSAVSFYLCKYYTFVRPFLSEDLTISTSLSALVSTAFPFSTVLAYDLSLWLTNVSGSLYRGDWNLATFALWYFNFY